MARPTTLPPPAARKLREEFVAAVSTISKLSGLSVCLHDLSGFTRIDGKRVFPDRMHRHYHPFCVRHKTRNQPACYRQDFEQANRRAGELRKVFIKRCYAGAIEAVVPVFVSGNHVATLFAGPAAERGRKPPPDGRSLPIRSRAELAQTGRLLALLAGYAAEASEGLVLHNLARATHSDPVRKAVEIAERRYAEWLTVATVAKEVFLSASRFAHVFTREMGMPFHQYLAALRVERAKGLLANSSLTVGEIASRTGFCNQNYFASVFREKAGVAPTEYRRCQQDSVDI